MKKWPAGDGETGRGLGRNLQFVLSAVLHPRQGFSCVSRSVLSAFNNAHRIRKLKDEVARLSAHIDLINVCHADRVVALERECRQKIGAHFDELGAIVAKVVPPDLNEEVQIIISGQTAREFWGRFACLRDDEADSELTPPSNGCWGGAISPINAES